MTTTTPKVRNSTSDQWCDACGTTGWVELAGTVRDMGLEYSRGSTACRWCEMGTLVYGGFLDKLEHLRPLSRYDWDDIVPIGPHGVPVGSERAKEHIERCRAILRPWAGRSREWSSAG